MAPHFRGKQRRRSAHATALITTLVITGTVTLISEHAAAPAQAAPYIPCEQWQQMHPGWPCIDVPEPPSQPPATPSQPALPSWTPNQPGTGGGGGAGALTPPSIPPGNGTPIVPVPSQTSPETDPSQHVPATSVPPQGDQEPVLGSPDGDTPAPTTPDHPAPETVSWPWLKLTNVGRLVTKDEAPDYVTDCGIVTCTVYFNKATTDFVASGATTTSSAAVCGLLAAATATIGGAVCALVAAPVVVEANWAKSHGTCLKIKYTKLPPPAGTWWPDTYSGGNCR